MTPTDFPTVPPTQVPSATPTEHPTKGAPTSCSYVGPFNSKYGKGNGDEPNARRNCEGNGAPCYVTRHTKPALTVSTRTNGKANNVCKEFCDKTPNCACVVEMDGHHCWLRTANYCSSKESELKSWGGMTTFTKTDPSCTVKSGAPAECTSGSVSLMPCSNLMAALSDGTTNVKCTPPCQAAATAFLNTCTYQKMDSRHKAAFKPLADTCKGKCGAEIAGFERIGTAKNNQRCQEGYSDNGCGGRKDCRIPGGGGNFPSAAKVAEKCAANSQCKGFNWIDQGAYLHNADTFYKCTPTTFSGNHIKWSVFVKC